jgi:hypothetical protein
MAYVVHLANGGKQSAKRSDAEQRRVCSEVAARSRGKRTGSSAAAPASKRRSGIATDVVCLAPGSVAASTPSRRSNEPAAVMPAPSSTVMVGNVQVPLQQLRDIVRSESMQQQLGVLPLEQVQVAAHVGLNLKALLPTIKQHARTEIGRKTHAAIMAAAAPDPRASSSGSSNGSSSSRSTAISQSAYADFLDIDKN